MQTYEALRAMKGPATKTRVTDLAVGDVVREDGTKYRVQTAPRVAETGSVIVEVYSEDNQPDTWCLGSRSILRVIGTLP